jgi:aspartate carbamoyltransferase catalytic subunit
MPDLLSIADLTDAEIDRVLGRAAELVDRAPPAPTGRPLVATLFLTPSMRTRVGFAAAAHRLGGACIFVDELRFDGAMSASESYADALRVVSGMVDVVVTRVGFELDADLVASVPAAVVSGGDLRHHPTQALIDLAAVERSGKPVAECHLLLCGDLTMRAARSFLDLLARRPPRALTVVHPDSRPPELPSALVPITSRGGLDAAADADVVSMIGLPPTSGDDHLDDAARAPFVMTGEVVATLRPSAVVISPMPVVDEIDDAARRDPRLRMFEQSDHAVFVRMAVLEHLVGAG